MVSVAQLVRASDCGSEGRGFESHLSPCKIGEHSNGCSPFSFEYQSYNTIMKRTFLLLFVILCSTISYAQMEMKDRHTYTTVENIPYHQGVNDYATERCKLDLYYPTDLKDFPTVVWFHGGGLTGGSKYLPEQLKQSGMAVIAVNYRLMPKCQLSDCIDDAAAAVAWAFKNISKYGGSAKKIFVCGHSAGGYLTDMVGLDKKWLAKYDIDADSIAALIPFSGQVITHFAYRKSKGIKETTPVIDEFAPLFYVRPDCPPVIIITADREQEMLGRYEEDAYFWRMLKVVGHKETYLYEMQGYNHGNMPEPAFHILKTHINKILKSSGETK